MESEKRALEKRNGILRMLQKKTANMDRIKNTFNMFSLRYEYTGKKM